MKIVNLICADVGIWQAAKDAILIIFSVAIVFLIIIAVNLFRINKAKNDKKNREDESNNDEHNVCKNNAGKPEVEQQTKDKSNLSEEDDWVDELDFLDLVDDD